MSIGQNIKRLRETHGMNQSELAQIAGVTDKAVSTWENDLKIPRMGAIQKMADYFHISKSAIIEDDPQTPVPPYPGVLPVSRRSVPLLGSIACGEPIFADEDYSASVALGHDIDCDFALRCKGDSMIGARIYDGDIVFIKKQDFVDDGTIAAVLIDDDATLKRVYKLSDGRIELRAANERYRPIFVGGPDDTRTFRVLGKAVAFQSLL